MTDFKKYMVFNSSGSHEYDITKELIDEGEKITLYHSNTGSWTDNTKGKKILSIINDGNNIKFDKTIKTIDYSGLFELRLLLNFENKTDSNTLNHETYKIVEDIKLFEL
jgi:hypothetical protein